jgi:transcriptional regulator with XRE-family HTH domain
MDIVTQIKAIRKATGLSQSEFGRRIGLSRDVVAAIELRRKDYISDILLEHIFDIFHVSRIWLKTEKGPVLDDKAFLLSQKLNAVFLTLNPALQKTALRQVQQLHKLQTMES